MSARSIAVVFLAVALSAAAVLHPVAGGFDPDAYARFGALVTVRPIAAPSA